MTTLIPSPRIERLRVTAAAAGVPLVTTRPARWNPEPFPPRRARRVGVLPDLTMRRPLVTRRPVVLRSRPTHRRRAPWKVIFFLSLGGALLVCTFGHDPPQAAAAACSDGAQSGGP